MAFKTGTSYGQRDAWAAGLRGDWAVVVWGGRPDGTAIPGITGLGTSAPVLMHVFDILPESGVLPADMMPVQATLSPALQKLDEKRGPQIVQPVNGGRVECFAEDGRVTPLGLVASGGTEPYRWLINGVPLDTPIGITPSWTPDAPVLPYRSYRCDRGRECRRYTRAVTAYLSSAGAYSRPRRPDRVSRVRPDERP